MRCPLRPAPRRRSRRPDPLAGRQGRPAIPFDHRKDPFHEQTKHAKHLIRTSETPNRTRGPAGSPTGRLWWDGELAGGFLPSDERHQREVREGRQQRRQLLHPSRGDVAVDRGVDAADHRLDQFLGHRQVAGGRCLAEEAVEAAQQLGAFRAGEGAGRVDLHHRRRGERGQLGEDLQQHPERGAGTVAPGGFGAVRGLHQVQEQVGAVAVRGDQRVVLAGEQGVERGPGHAGGAADVADGGVGVPLLGDGVHDGVEEALPLVGRDDLGRHPAGPAFDGAGGVACLTGPGQRAQRVICHDTSIDQARCTGVAPGVRNRAE